MAKKLLVGLIVIILGFILLVMLQPSDFSVSRSLPINAPPESIFPHINDLKKFNVWNPWTKMDPNAKGEYGGPEAGVGTNYSWDGEKSGAGKMTVRETIPNNQVKMRLDFTRPMPAINEVTFTLASQGNETLVTWMMTGKNNFVSKALHLMMSVDKMVGGSFEQGLNDLKSIVENPASK